MSIKLFNFRVDNYSFQEAIEKAIELSKQDKVSQIITINPEMIEYGKKHTDFSNILNSAEMIIPDGIGIKIALKVNGYNVERIPGIDFAYSLLTKSANDNLPVAIVGAKNSIVEMAVNNLKSKIDNLNIVYYHDGYFNNDEEIYNDLLERKPRIILVAMGSPRQEQFIYNAKNKLQFGLMVGIGGSLDVWSGNIKRAPLIFQKLGLEWLYRITTEPKRIKRVFPALPLFILSALKFRYNKKES